MTTHKVDKESLLQNFDNGNFQRYKQYFRDHAQRYAHMINHLQTINIGGQVLDAGGLPEISKLLQGYFKNIDNIQLSEDDLESSDWAKSYKGLFDFALCAEVIEHLSEDPAEMLHQLNVSLKMGGLLYLTTVNISRLVSIHNIIHGINPLVFGCYFGKCNSYMRHKREYAPLELAKFVAAHGFACYLFTDDSYITQPYELDFVKRLVDQLPFLDKNVHGDTIFIVAKKVQESVGPMRMDPIYCKNVQIPLPEETSAFVENNVHVGPPLSALSQLPFA